MKKMGIKVGICLLLITPLLGPFNAPVTAEENVDAQAAQDIVNIPDPVLKSYLNGILGQPSTSDITEAQMDTITEVKIDNISLADLTGLDYAHNLTLLQLSTPRVSDYSIIAKLSNLTTLNLTGYSLSSSSLPDLNGLQKLTSLTLYSGRFVNSDLAKFNQLPNLTYLNLDRSGYVTDITLLKSLPNLTTLSIQFCGVNDFRGIDTFPSLTNLSANGQNIGGSVLIKSDITSEVLNYNKTNQTIFIPFTLMTSRSINFDGVPFPFTTDASDAGTYLSFNNQQIDGSRLTIDDTGITVSGITPEYLRTITKMEYNAFYDNPAGSYATPPNFTSYSVSGGTYDQFFDITQVLVITNDSAINYTEKTTVTEEQFLTDIHAKTEDGTPVTSDFDSVVDFSKPGVYTVTLNATNADGLQATPKKVTVTILEKPIITADKSINYKVNSTKTAEEFLTDISAKTSDGSEVTSNFDSAVDLTKVGTYKVTLNAVSVDGVAADPVTVLVNVVSSEEPPTPPNPTPDPDNPAVNPSQPTNVDGTTSPNNSGDNVILPYTGDENQATTVLIGIILAGVAILFFRKRKHS
ncbi:LapB repeat-containing protein [Listeria monocytogenes]|uniref:LPXTG cell wall anchor domain-containing protein n=1 Tax=Listeria monocytogenes TaxID=1639 RepID=A0A823J132_LISMN|nr:LapB repeat-containing protein [Listeria monocytogenes]EAC6873881.1 LPXTG cell wall anchor domain-containing protein [Listeria monocytogenes]EAD1933557.1 LPXTG cell wall anchor domain-containing protein [Listeria monocytogenes]EAG9220822.1 LPXTG cell wall anchor domain-containing protein [Listeria monocytogenes]EAG9321284.1 LPXTG cell wall anchor domain-containing protein [Listeria monocytogenes]EAG9352686.1 LPXTG cell wall anchor domain-containing protein [Listeria monocytogenes]